MMKILALLVVLLLALDAAPSDPTLRVESFDRDPGWEGLNNRSREPDPREVRQDFGYSRTTHCGALPGEVGGRIVPAAEPAYYARVIPQATLEDRLSASGRLVVAKRGEGETGAGNTLIGFFNAGTINEWRTPNSLAFRINGRGDRFHPHVEYATGRWRAGAGFFGELDERTGRKQIREIASGPTVHRWSLLYQPGGDRGSGSITATLDGETVVLPLEPGHRGDGACFDRFGILNVTKSADDAGSLWIDDLVVNGAPQPLDHDPGWEGRGNRLTYTTANVRPRFDFGYSRTAYAGGQPGEIGGLLFRGDQRHGERLAAYGDRLEPLTLDRPLLASGKVCLRRGVTDSTVLFGFYHHQGSLRVGPEQTSGLPENFVGAVIEGPSRDGFFFYPACALDPEGSGRAARFEPPPPHILPDGRTHAWTLEYLPAPDGGGRITTTLDGRGCTLILSPAERAPGARFNRFGFVTTHIDGNGQHVYLDDLVYSCR